MATFTNTNMNTGKKSAGQANEVQLNRKQMFRIDGGHGQLLLKALSGKLWVTRSGDPQDYVLQSGDHLSVSKKGTLLIEALSDARLRIL